MERVALTVNVPNTAEMYAIWVDNGNAASVISKSNLHLSSGTGSQITVVPNEL